MISVKKKAEKAGKSGEKAGQVRIFSKNPPKGWLAPRAIRVIRD